MLPPIPSLTGREEDIHILHDKLQNLDCNKLGVVITGMGGVGKSELVKRYCQDFCQSVYEGNILWINAATDNSIESAFYNIADMIKLEITDTRGRELSIQAVISKVYRCFGGRNVLFVFDNVNDPHLIHNYLNTYFQGSPKRPSIIITTQYTICEQRYELIKLEVMTINDSMSLLRKSLKGKFGLMPENNKKVCQMVGQLPLALQQSMSYIVNNEMMVSDYIEHFEELMSIEQNDVCYTNTIMAAWKMALEKLEQSKNPLAIDLINMMSYLDGKDIKKDISLDICGNDIVKLNASITVLQKYSLINTSRESDETSVVTIHSLVQLVVRKGNKTNKYWIMFLKIIFSSTNNEKEYHVDFGKKWIHHIEHMVNNCDNNDDLLKTVARQRSTLYKLYASKGKFQKMADLCQT